MNHWVIFGRIQLIDHYWKNLTQLAFDLKLSKEQAQGLVGWYAKQVQETVSGAKEESEKMIAPLKQEWGAKYDERLAEANLVVTKLGGEKLHEILSDTGAGAHPLVIKMFRELLPLVTEGGSRKGEAHPGSSQTIRSAEEVLYHMSR